MLKSKYEQVPPKTITYRYYKNVTEEHFKGGNLNSLQHVLEKRLDQFASMKKIVLRGNNKPHVTSQLRKAIMKRSQLKHKANKSGKPTLNGVFPDELKLPAVTPL